MADHPPPGGSGSPSDQLAAFTPREVGAATRRAHASSIAGTSSVRDPFVAWSGAVGLPGLNLTSFLQGGQAMATSPAPGSDVNTAAFQPQQTQQSRGHRQHSSLSFGSTQVTPNHALGRFQSSPSAQASSPLGQGQYLAPRSQAVQAAQDAIAQSQYPLAPEPAGTGGQGSSSLYSPSREQASDPYSPTRGFPSQMLAELGNRAVLHSQTQEQTAGASARSPHGSISSVFALPRTPSRAAGSTPRRCLIVGNVSRDIDQGSILQELSQEKYRSIEGVLVRQIPTTGQFSALFADVRDAIEAHAHLCNIKPDWNVVYATVHEVVQSKLSGPFTDHLSQENGQLVVCAFIEPNQRGREFAELTDEYVNQLFSKFGSVRNCNRISEDSASVREYRVEYYNIHHAAHAFSCLSGLLLGSLRFDVTYQPSGPIRTPRFGTPSSPVTPFRCSPNDRFGMDMEPTSPNMDDKITADHAIDLGKISRGEDLRTTVMIRNIPNKITSAQLKTILDESSFAKYDFVYLRMDFLHHCNVGYAFVNFGDPMHIIDLVVTRQGTTWPDCISEKRAEVSYATQQGKEALIQKFRNSNVMTRPHEERPHLYYLEGLRAGTEAPFPGPNDANKLRRSVASTNQQGLFAPRTRTLNGNGTGTGTPPRDRNGASPRAVRTRNRAMSSSQNPQSTRTSPHVVRRPSRRSVNEETSSAMQIDGPPRFIPNGANGRH